MKLTNEQLQAVKECSSAEELIAKAATFDVELSAEEAQKFFNKFSMEELNEEDINDISGGCCTTAREKSDGKYKCPGCGTNGNSCISFSIMKEKHTLHCNNCGRNYTIEESENKYGLQD